MTDTYVRLTEENEWEGETWHHYLPVTGNEQALNTLRELIRNAFDDFGFTLGEETYTKVEVDTLARLGNDGNGYLPLHTTLAGRLAPVDDLEKLYKGQITDFMSAAP